MKKAILRGYDMKNKQPSQKFGLLTSISMIVGIVIGSGIFFRTPIIMERVNGNIISGLFVFIVAAFSIIFGGLTLAQYAQNTDTAGGVISYCESAWGKTIAYVAGWFQTIFYYPALNAVVTWVAANYTCALFGLPNLLVSGEVTIHVWIVTAIYLIGLFLLNTLATKSAGRFQSIAMFTKIAALIILALGGLFFGSPVETFANSGNYHTVFSGFLGAVVVVAFAFDGWSVAPSIAHEIKNPKKNLPIALTIAPLIITGIYILYFLGVVSYTGPDAILAGQDPIQILASGLFGDFGMRIVLLFIVISVLGTSNGLILGYIRLPYALAIRNSLPMSEQLAEVHPKYDIPIKSVGLAFFITAIWTFFHYLSINGVVIHGWTLFEGLEVDNLPIVLMYLFYILLYVGAIKLNKKDGFIKRYIIPIFAIAGALIIVYGGLIQPKFNVYLIICIIGIIAGLLIRPKNMLK